MRAPLLSLAMLMTACAPVREGSPPGDDDDATADEPAEIAVRGAWARCEGSSFQSVSVEPLGGGELWVHHFAHSEGCGPQIEVTASADEDAMILEADVRLYDDFDDCICSVDVEFVLQGIPAGTWTLIYADSTTEVVVD